MNVHFPSTALPHAWRGDALFFDAHPTRRFRARPFREGDFLSGVGPRLAVFAEQVGALTEVNLVIIKRVCGGRQRMLFAAPDHLRLRTDRAIIAFLRSRGIKQGRGLSPMSR